MVPLRPGPLIWALLFAAALLPRLIMAINTPVIAIDGVGYIEASRGGTDAAAQRRLPLYPLAIKALTPLVNDPVVAGKIVSVLAGTLFPFLCYLLARLLLPGIGAAAVFLLAAFQPYLIRYSGDVLTEPLFLTLMAALYLFAVAARQKAWFAIPAGAAGTLLCLTRPEGLGVVFFLILAWLYHKPSRSAAGLFLLTLALCLVPAYLSGAFDGGSGGTLSKTYFEKLAAMEGTEPPDPTPSLSSFVIEEPLRFLKKTGLGLGEAAVELVEAVHPAVFALSLVGFFILCRRKIMLPSLLLIPSLGLFLFFAAVFPSKRYLLQCSIPFLLSAGWSIHWIRGKGVIVLVVCILCWAKAGLSQRTDKLYLRERGEAIAAASQGKTPWIITGSARAVFYAGGKRIDPKKASNREGLMQIMAQAGDSPVFLLPEKEVEDLSSLDITVLKLR